MKKKRKREIPTSEQRERFARTQRMLAERIAYHSARLGEEPDPRLMIAATKTWSEMTLEERADEQARQADTLRRLEARIAHHERLIRERGAPE